MVIGLEVLCGVDWKIVSNLCSDLLHESFQSDVMFNTLPIAEVHYLAWVHSFNYHI